MFVVLFFFFFTNAMPCCFPFDVPMFDFLDLNQRSMTSCVRMLGGLIVYDLKFRNPETAEELKLVGLYLKGIEQNIKALDLSQ